jgi:hypothetical protein
MFTFLISESFSIKSISSRERPRPQIQSNAQNYNFKIRQNVDPSMKIKRCYETELINDASMTWDLLCGLYGLKYDELRELNDHISKQEWSNGPYQKNVRHYVDTCGDQYIDQYNRDMGDNYASLGLALCYMGGYDTLSVEGCKAAIRSAGSFFIDSKGRGWFPFFSSSRSNLLSKFNLEETEPTESKRIPVFQLHEVYKDGVTSYIVVDRFGEVFDPLLKGATPADAKETFWIKRN